MVKVVSLTGVRHLLSQPDLEAGDVMHCLLGLRSLEINVYFYLLRGAATVREVSEALGRDRSTVQRAIQNLVSRGLASRRTRTLRRGGYVYVYEAVSLSTLKSLIKEALDNFYRQMVNFLDSMWAESVRSESRLGRWRY